VASSVLLLARTDGCRPECLCRPYAARNGLLLCLSTSPSGAGAGIPGRWTRSREVVECSVGVEIRPCSLGATITRW
jgi:hypothetical protein